MIELSLNKRSEQRETISQSIFCAEIKLNEWNIASVHHIQRSYEQEPVLFEREKGQVAIGHYSMLSQLHDIYQTNPAFNQLEKLEAAKAA